MAVFPAVLDACVLYGIGETDILLELSGRSLYRPHWSPEILDEIRRNLLANNPRLSAAALDRRFAEMDRAEPGASVIPPPELVEAMRNDPSDRHVLALAVHVNAPVVVTHNVGDFPPEICEAHGVEAQTPDVFVGHLVDLSPHSVRESVLAIVGRRRNAPNTAIDVFSALEPRFPQAFAALAARCGPPQTWS